MRRAQKTGSREELEKLEQGPEQALPADSMAPVEQRPGRNAQKRAEAGPTLIPRTKINLQVD